jgi:hypothetical protein
MATLGQIGGRMICARGSIVFESPIVCNERYYIAEASTAGVTTVELI